VGPRDRRLGQVRPGRGIVEAQGVQQQDLARDRERRDLGIAGDEAAGDREAGPERRRARLEEAALAGQVAPEPRLAIGRLVGAHAGDEGEQGRSAEHGQV